MTKTHRSKRSFPAFVLCFATSAVLAGCATNVDEEPVSQTEDALGKREPVIPEMKWLAELPTHAEGERALAKMFAHGTADYVPVGDGVGYPILSNRVPALSSLGSQLWGGKTLFVASSDKHPNGDPVVHLDNKILKGPNGGLFNLFDAVVERRSLVDFQLGTNDRRERVYAPAVGTIPTIYLSGLSDPIAIDNKPSVVLNYFQDRSLPIIRRILDEIREIDGQNCKGLFLGRAHVRRCASFYCGEAPSLEVDLPASSITFETKHEWRFWTYFLLDFGRTGTCDLTDVATQVRTEIAAEGRTATFPAPPAR